MPPLRHTHIRTLLIVLFFVMVFGYAYYEGRHLIRGPEISLTTEDVLTTNAQKVAIQGVAERIVELRLNGRPISVTESGQFYEEILLAPGYNTITLLARDKAGRETVREVRVVYEKTAHDIQQSLVE